MTTSKEYNVYIDESGDEGIKRGSKFFILTAIIVEKDEDLKISKTVDIIKTKLSMNVKMQLHWNTIKGYSNKIMIMKKISSIDIYIINIIIDTNNINYIKTDKIYNHFSGYLYERICWFVRDKNAMANIIISSRGSNLTKNKLVSFLKNNDTKYQIDYNRINSIQIYPNAKKRLLQLADCCSSALGQALKYNNNKHFKYIVLLENKLYSYNKKYIGYGLKYVPTDIKYSPEFNKLIIYLNK